MSITKLGISIFFTSIAINLNAQVLPRVSAPLDTDVIRNISSHIVSDADIGIQNAYKPEVTGLVKIGALGNPRSALNTLKDERSRLLASFNNERPDYVFLNGKPEFPSSTTELREQIQTFDRTLQSTRTIRLVQDLSLGSAIGPGDFRYEIEYSLPGENFTKGRVIVPAASSLDSGANELVALFPRPFEEVIDLPFDGRDIIHREDEILSIEEITQLDANTQKRMRHRDPRYNSNPIFIEPGTEIQYRWQIRSSVNLVKSSETHSFTMPRPLLIGIIGDSFTAGEGAPNSKSSIIPPQQAHWTSSRRHHSKKSGFNLALKKFREDNPELWLVYKNVASSGATFTPHAAGFSGGYSTDQLTDRDLIALTLPIIVNGIPVPVPWIHASQTNVRNPAQVDSLEQWVDGLPFDAEKLDIVLMMGGGNDAGFGSIITSAILGNALTLGFSGTVFIPSNDEVEVKLSDARPHVRFFSDRLRDKLNPENVYWINYPNFFRNNRGERASSDNRDGVSFQASAVGNVALMAISNNIGGEVLHRGESIITGILNPFVSEMCRDEIDNCTVVDITEALGTNGLNQSDSSRRAVNTILDAQEKIQGSIDGGIHPNERGYQAYVAPVVDQLNENYHPIEGSNYAIYSSPKNYLELQSTRSRTFNSATTTRRPSRSARVSLNSIPNITEAEESNCGVFRNQLDHVEWVKFEKLPPDLYQTMRRKYRNSPKLLEKLQNYYDGMTQIGWKIRKEEYCNAVKEATQNIKNH